MPSKPDRRLSFGQVAAKLGLAEGTLRNGGCGTRTIPRLRLGRRVVFSEKTVDAWIINRDKNAKEERRRAEARAANLELERRRRRKIIRDTLTNFKRELRDAKKS